MDKKLADKHSKKINEALKVVLVDRLEVIAQKRCYICDGSGIVRNYFISILPNMHYNCSRGELFSIKLNLN
jgi:hypothetical protein